MPRRVATTWRTFRAAWKELLLFVLFFQALTFVVLAPIGSFLLSRLVAAGGSAVVGNEELAAFLLSPLGVVAFFVFATGFVALQFTGLAGLVWIAAQRGTAYAALRRMVRDAPRLLELTARQIAVGLLCVAPFLVAALAAFLLLTGDKDINYLLAKRPPSFWILAAILAVLALGALTVVVVVRIRFFFAVPVYLFERVSPRKALAASRQLGKGASWPVTRVFLGWWIAGVFVLWAGESVLVLDLYRERRGLEPEIATPDRPPRQARVMLVTAVVGLVVLALALGGIVGELVDVRRDVKVTAHRGSSGRAPENTLSALRAAIEDGADYAWRR